LKPDKTLEEWLRDCRAVTEAHIRKHGDSWELVDQLLHAQSEISEVYSALRKDESRERVLEEMADCIYSAITMFHIFGANDSEIIIALTAVMRKIADRAGILYTKVDPYK